MIELKTDRNESTATQLSNIYRGLLVSKRLKDFVSNAFMVDYLLTGDIYAICLKDMGVDE